ncbi:MAG: response regulator transcription factor [Firmicutes bacterium]|nr:response regulator transcription factor [Bacillota bacterium]
MEQRILIVEDEESINRAVSAKLTKEGYTVYSAACIKEGADLYSKHNAELIICDINLPDGNGLDFCELVRRENDVMFLFLTALDTEIDMINGYEAGADDYITKPFSLAVLCEKVKAIMRRINGGESGNIIVSGPMTLFISENRAKKDGEYLNLTANEQKLLIYFMENPGRILSKNSLLSAIYDIDGNFVDENTLAVNIRRLREKIEKDPSKPSMIKNVRGLGYIWEEDCKKL